MSTTGRWTHVRVGARRCWILHEDVAVDSIGPDRRRGGMGSDSQSCAQHCRHADASFGTNGVVTPTWAAKAFDARHARRDPARRQDRRRRNGGQQRRRPATTRTAISAPRPHNANGSLDTTFGNAGTETVLGSQTLTPVSGLGFFGKQDRLLRASSAAAASSADPDFDFITFRLNSNGALDGTFGDARSNGSAGYVVTGMGGEDTAAGQVIESDGKIVIGGTRMNIDDDVYEHTPWRGTPPPGKLDTSFDGDGKVNHHDGFRVDLYSIAKIRKENPRRRRHARRDGVSRVMVERFNRDGRPTARLVHGTLLTRTSTQHPSVATNVFFRATRSSSSAWSRLPGQSPSSTFAAQYNYIGQLDSSFGTNGIAHFDIPGGALWARAALAPDGKMVFAS